MIRALESELKGVIVEKKEIITPKMDYNLLFKKLKEKLYDRDFDLGECFEKNISFNKYTDNTLSWNSTAEAQDRQHLISHWSLINRFVKNIFGDKTKIVNIPTPKEPKRDIPTNMSIDDIQEQFNTATIEDFEMKSSCIAPPSGGVEAAKEKEPNNILDEPMIKEAIELFNPKKVRIIKK
jgi:DNA polymerase-3 subunit gamma/tau